MCLELIGRNGRTNDPAEHLQNAQNINHIYQGYLYGGISSDTQNFQCDPVPASWYAYDFFDGECFTALNTKKLEEIERWFNEYGVDYFKELDMWNIQHVQELCNRYRGK